MKLKVPKLGPPPKPSSKFVSKVMKANRAKDTRPELLLREALSKMGLRGYRLHNKKIPGRPDISFTKSKVAIFVNGCFWHRCPYCKPSLPKTHRIFWRKKFIRNKERDKRKKKNLKRLGWKVFEFWECRVKKNPYKCAMLIKNYVTKSNVQ